MSAQRTTSGADGEPEGAPEGSSLPPLVARELANRRARGGEGDRPRHARPGRGAARPAGAGAVGIAGLVLVVFAVLAAVAVLWPRDDGGTSIEAAGVTTTESPFDGVAERESSRGTTVPGPSSTGTTGTTAPPTTPAPTEAAPEGAGDGGSATSAPPSPSSSAVPPSTAPAPAPAPSTTTTTPAHQRSSARPGDPDDDATWDALASCESGGNWSADPGRGRYGGLMIDDDTWDRYGGRRRPHQNDRETQIEIARRIQDDRGWDYWDECAGRLGFR